MGVLSFPNYIPQYPRFEAYTTPSCRGIFRMWIPDHKVDKNHQSLKGESLRRTHGPASEVQQAYRTKYRSQSNPLRIWWFPLFPTVTPLAFPLMSTTLSLCVHLAHHHNAGRREDWIPLRFALLVFTSLSQWSVDSTSQRNVWVSVPRMCHMARPFCTYGVKISRHAILYRIVSCKGLQISTTATLEYHWKTILIQCCRKSHTFFPSINDPNCFDFVTPGKFQTIFS